MRLHAAGYASPNDESVKDGAMYCDPINDRSTGQFHLGITKWAANR